jgi:hypothetical protein
MPIQSSALVGGKESLLVAAHAGLSIDVETTGGGVSVSLPLSPSITSEEAIEAYEYRNLEIDAEVSFDAEVRDANGRLKWAIDGDHIEID